jgi:putative nucleotidyltransferase with HDIG domain
MDEEEVKNHIYAKVDELPTLPAVVPKLLSLMEDAGSHMTQVTHAISQDPALTSKILKVANSAYYGFPKGIADLERAVALLGFNMVKSLALSIGVIKSLSERNSSAHFSHKDLWLHSVTVATGMKNLGKRHCSGQDSEHLFVIGLLHDMGKLVLEQFFSNAFLDVMELAPKSGKALSHAEKGILGFDHGEVGAMVLRRWNFPDRIVDPIEVHHQTGFPKGGAPKVIATLRLADSLAQDREGEESAGPSVEIHEYDMETLSMDAVALERARKDLVGEKEGIEAFMNVLI